MFLGLALCLPLSGPAGLSGALADAHLMSHHLRSPSLRSDNYVYCFIKP
jgi:hypothetical protein